MCEKDPVAAIGSLINVIKADNRISVDLLPQNDDNFNRVTFWLHLNVESEKLGRCVTKLMLVQSLDGPCVCNDVMPIIGELEECYRALVGCYTTLPLTKGYHLAKAVTSYLASVHSALIHFLNSFTATLINQESEVDVRSVGLLVEECHKVSNLPNNNKEAVLSLIQLDSDFILDTVDEITSELKNQTNLRRSGKQGVVLCCEDGDGHEDGELWPEAEFNILSLSLRLAKLGRTSTQFLLKLLKHKGEEEVVSGGNRGESLRCSSSGGCDDVSTRVRDILLLDELGRCCSQLSPQLDDIFASIYPPIDTHTLPSLVDQFVNSLSILLSSTERLNNVTEGHKSLIGNIRTQLDKTTQELKTLLVSNEIIGISELSIT